MFQNSRTLDILLGRFWCTPLGSKLIFWVFSHHFAALQRLFGFAPYTLRLKLVFQVVSRHFIATPDPLWKSLSGALNARVYASETISCFVTMNMPNPLFQSKTHVLGGSMPLHSRTWHIAKTDIEAHLMHEFMPLEPFLVFLQYWVNLKHEFMPRKPFLVWSQWTCSIHNLGLKLMFTILLDTSMHFLHSFWR